MEQLCQTKEKSTRLSAQTAIFPKLSSLGCWFARAFVFVPYSYFWPGVFLKFSKFFVSLFRIGYLQIPRFNFFSIHV
jgi:hypothetical protein